MRSTCKLPTLSSAIQKIQYRLTRLALLQPKIHCPSKPGRQKTGHRIEDECLYKALKKAVTEDQVERADWQEKKMGQFKASRSIIECFIHF